MKRLFIISVLFVVSVSGVSAKNAPELDSLWNRAVNAYTTADYQAALDSFLSIEEAGAHSADLYYNIANSYYKSGNSNGKAILYYRRALRMNPSFEDAEMNLSMARAQTLDEIDVVPEFVLITWVRNVRNSFSSDVWAWGAVILFVLFLAALFFFRFGRSSSVVRLSFVAGIVFLVAVTFCFGCSFSLKKEFDRVDKAVVLAPVSSGKGSPNDNAQSLFVIHEGTDVTIIEELGQWIRVELTDGRQGWIKGN
ncbi:MAG: tetratricopeptide repeat protein, partial [Alistipes sp.]|nr:tetratricopeptide repeat protein [Candidatus Minthomonas equi]